MGDDSGAKRAIAIMGIVFAAITSPFILSPVESMLPLTTYPNDDYDPYLMEESSDLGNPAGRICSSTHKYYYRQ